MILKIGLFFALLTGCAGYNLKSKENPFSHYGIKTLAVPLFYNHSNIAHASAIFTKELVTYLRKFKGLQIQNEMDESTDGVLIGIIESPGRYKQTVTNGDNRVTADIAPTSISKDVRGEFYIPAITQVNLKVRFVLLKNPSNEMIEFMKRDVSKKINFSENVIFNETISVSKSFNREIFDSEAKSVNATQNRKALQRTVRDLAFSTKNSFSELILYAF